jgi:hypothetical protein
MSLQGWPKPVSQVRILPGTLKVIAGKAYFSRIRLTGRAISVRSFTGSANASKLRIIAGRLAHSAQISSDT